MHIDKIGDEYGVFDLFDDEDDRQNDLQHDDILETSKKYAGSSIIIEGNSEKLANDERFLSLLASEDHPNITAAAPLLKQIKNENLIKLRKSLILDEFDNLYEHGSDTERIAALLDALGKKTEEGSGKRSGNELTISNVKVTKDNKISAVINGVEQVGTIKYGRNSSDGININLNIQFVGEATDDDYFDMAKKSKTIRDIERDFKWAVLNNIEFYNQNDMLAITPIDSSYKVRDSELTHGDVYFSFSEHPFENISLSPIDTDHCDVVPVMKDIDKYIAYDHVKRSTCLFNQEASSIEQEYQENGDNSLDGSYKVRFVMYVPKRDVVDAFMRGKISFGA